MPTQSYNGHAHRTLQLAPVPESAPAARRAVVSTLDAVGRDDLGDTAGLLVSELVTNAIVHAHTLIEVRIRAAPRGLRVEVIDLSPRLPSPRDYGESATTGRGLGMVDLLADSSGTEPHGAGKKVWFELGSAAAETEDTHSAPPPSANSPPARVVRVVLRHLPVELFRAWQQHADALLREYLLACWETEEDAAPQLAEHASASEAFAALAEAASPVFQDAEPPAHADVLLDLPDGTAARFDDLSRVLDRANVMAESGQLLAPALQPEIRHLRRWACDEVLGQVQGAAPQPWSGVPTDDLPAPALPVDWDPTWVLFSAEAVIAADDTNRILAASQPALELLGWETEQLTGRRIVSVIPHRFRERHIASFTLHLLTGRTTILDVPVVVPARRRDGSELLVELHVRRELAGSGRAVFVATLRPAQT